MTQCCFKARFNAMSKSAQPPVALTLPPPLILLSQFFLFHISDIFATNASEQTGRRSGRARIQTVVLIGHPERERRRGGGGGV